ncbi:60S ribosomal protein L19 [Xylographa bjoerkii]|nr:60S ribosomal protein L19 [Xylographa bjoerkii]
MLLSKQVLLSLVTSAVTALAYHNNDGTNGLYVREAAFDYNSDIDRRDPYEGHILAGHWPGFHDNSRIQTLFDDEEAFHSQARDAAYARLARSVKARAVAAKAASPAKAGTPGNAALPGKAAPQGKAAGPGKAVAAASGAGHPAKGGPSKPRSCKAKKGNGAAGIKNAAASPKKSAATPKNAAAPHRKGGKLLKRVLPPGTQNVEMESIRHVQRPALIGTDGFDGCTIGIVVSNTGAAVAHWSTPNECDIEELAETFMEANLNAGALRVYLLIAQNSQTHAFALEQPGDLALIQAEVQTQFQTAAQVIPYPWVPIEGDNGGVGHEVYVDATGNVHFDGHQINH